MACSIMSVRLARIILLRRFAHEKRIQASVQSVTNCESQHLIAILLDEKKGSDRNARGVNAKEKSLIGYGLRKRWKLRIHLCGR